MTNICIHTTTKKGTRRQHLALKICERCYKSCIHTTNVFIERHFVHRQIEHAQSAQNGDEGQFERQGALSGKTERHRCARHHVRKVRGWHHLEKSFGAVRISAATHAVTSAAIHPAMRLKPH